MRNGRSYVGCAISAGRSSVWSLTCFGHEQRWKPKSWCSNSNSSCCVGASQIGCHFWLSTGSFWAGLATYFRRPAARSPLFESLQVLNIEHCLPLSATVQPKNRGYLNHSGTAKVQSSVTAIHPSDPKG